MASNGQRMRVLSSGRRQGLAVIELATRAASTDQGQAASIVLAMQGDSGIWTVKLKTGRGVILQASASKAFKAAVLIASVAVVDLAAATASVVAADLGAVALADSAVVVAAGSEADVKN
jgi:hypothetical protein